MKTPNSFQHACPHDLLLQEHVRCCSSKQNRREAWNKAIVSKTKESSITYSSIDKSRLFKRVPPNDNVLKSIYRQRVQRRTPDWLIVIRYNPLRWLIYFHQLLCVRF